jgi:hypothetical protein
MSSLQSRFEERLTDFKLETLEKHPNSVYALSSDLKLIYFNPAWEDHFQENNVNEVCGKELMGEAILDAMEGPEKELYRKLFHKVMESGEPLKHEYECNSPSKLRIYSQDIYPLEQGGLLIVNSLRVEKDMEEAGRQAQPFIQENYLNEEGFYEQCSNCRRTKQVNTDTWDWVPALVEKMPENVSHSICPICFDHYWELA